jgi:hypothetical protein
LSKGVMFFISSFSEKRRVQAQGIQVFRLIYLSDEEFEFIKLKRLDYLGRSGCLEEESSREREDNKREAFRDSLNEDLKRGIHDYVPLKNQNLGCYEPTNMIYTRDCLYWSWIRAYEYFRDLSEWIHTGGYVGGSGKRREIIRIDPCLRKR